MTGFLVDTNVILELVHPRPDPNVTEWIVSAADETLFLSVLTLGEIRKGITTMPDSARQKRLETWLIHGLISRFEGRILPVDSTIADRWGRITGTLALRGTPLAVIDGLLAATALHHNLTLVTRNISDFVATGVALFDPWN